MYPLCILSEFSKAIVFPYSSHTISMFNVFIGLPRFRLVLRMGDAHIGKFGMVHNLVRSHQQISTLLSRILEQVVSHCFILYDTTYFMNSVKSHRES